MKNSLSKNVEHLVEKNPYIKYALGEGLINYSALARKLVPELETKLGKKINEESLIVAIKRFADKNSLILKSHDICELIGKSRLSMQDGVAYALIRRTPETFSAVDKMFEATDWDFDEIKTIVGSASHLVVMLKVRRMDTLLENIDESDIDEVDNNRALVTIRVPEQAFRMHGVLNEMTFLLAKNGISIDLLCMPPEIHFAVSEDDSERTYKLLKELVKECRDRAKDE